MRRLSSGRKKRTGPRRALEFRELRALLEFPGAARRLRALAEAAAQTGRARRERLDRSARGLPLTKLRGVRQVVEHDLARPANVEDLDDPHSSSASSPSRRRTHPLACCL